MRAPLFIAALVTMVAAYGQSDGGAIQKYRDQLSANPRDSLAHYQLAEIFFQQKNYQSAANEFRAALNGDLQPRWTEVWSHLRLVVIFDRSGQYERADNECHLAILTGDDTGGAQEVARECLKREPSQSQDLPRTAPAAFRTGLRPIGPEPIQEIEPEYSEEARAAGLEGTVFVEAAIAADGAPFDLQVTSPLGLGLDEKAIDAARQWRFPPPAPPQVPSARVPVNFLLPSKLSRWHLVGASFQPPEGASRAVFLTEPYPLGAGVSSKAIDEGWVISAIPRAANVTLQLDVDEHGIPANFQVLAASAPVWENEAIALVRKWRFTPGAKDGKPVPVPCTLDLVWGQKVWTAATLAQMRDKISPPAPSGPATPPASPAKGTVFSAYILEDSTPHSPYSVVLSVIIGADGMPSNVSVVRSLTPDYNAQAVEAVRTWHFTPALVNGVPVPLPALVELDFTASQ
ncbi:MAG TPA: TonB family protein [Bryobacteraceae bacterium]|nr:TonB family protein [Bryobacteraceae bacterium]